MIQANAVKKISDYLQTTVEVTARNLQKTPPINQPHNLQKKNTDS